MWGYWFRGRPSPYQLRQDRGELLARTKPDFDPTHRRGASRVRGRVTAGPDSRPNVVDRPGRRNVTMAETMLRTKTGAEPAGSSSKPIADYGLLSDCNTAALVARDGSVDWLCLPRFDGPAVFASILDPDAGHWTIRPVGDYTVERRYSDGSLVLETTFTTPTGSVRLRDALAFVKGQ